MRIRIAEHADERELQDFAGVHAALIPDRDKPRFALTVPAQLLRLRRFQDWTPFRSFSKPARARTLRTAVPYLERLSPIVQETERSAESHVWKVVRRFQFQSLLRFPAKELDRDSAHVGC